MLWIAISVGFLLLAVFVVGMCMLVSYNLRPGPPPEYRIIERCGRFRVERKHGEAWLTCRWSGFHGGGTCEWGVIDGAREWVADRMDDYTTSITPWEPVRPEQPCDSV